MNVLHVLLLIGFPAWPAKVDMIYGIRNQMCQITWFNDYRRSKILLSQCMKFHANFDEMSKLFGKHIGLETAAKEALMTLMNGFYE